MMDVALHLGGSGKAAVKTAESVYVAYDDVSIVVSSENPKHVLSYLPDIPVYHHREAWDTVTNFTTTYAWLKEKYDPKTIWIVCHGFHMERAMAIAKAVYWRRGVT